MSNVYGHPVLPLSAQPEGVHITIQERIENARFIAWRIYSEGFSYDATIGLLSAIYQESSCDPCCREVGGVGLGLYQRPITSTRQDFANMGYRDFETAWLDVVTNMYAQTDYIVYRLTQGSWGVPPRRHREGDNWVIDGYFSLYPQYELTKTQLRTSTDRMSCAAALAVMSLHPYGVNDAYGYYGNEPSADLLIQNVQSYQRMVGSIGNWFTEQMLIDYVPPNKNPKFKMIYYLRPLWWNTIRR